MHSPRVSQPLLEIAVQDAAGAQIAAEHGADRFEVCSALQVGGLTPSPGLVFQVTPLEIPTRILIRPRAGGYQYSRVDTWAMVEDIRTAIEVEAGGAGFVIGALTSNDTALDTSVLQRLVNAAALPPVVLHRCVDVLLANGTEPDALVEQALSLGVTGMLTSGGAARAGEGIKTITALVEASAGRLEIIAGGGVKVEDIPALVQAGVDAIHLSASAPTSAGSSGPGGGEDFYPSTSAELVTAARKALDAQL